MPRAYYLWQPGGPTSEYLVYVIVDPAQARRLLSVRPSAVPIGAKKAHQMGWKAPRAARYKGWWGVGGYVVDFGAPNPRSAEEAVAGAIRATRQLTDSAEGIWQAQVRAAEAALAAMEGMTGGTTAVPVDT